MAKNIHAVALGKKGGKARMNSLTKEQKHELAMLGVKARRKGKSNEMPNLQPDAQK